MSETIDGSDEVIFGFCLGIAHDELVEHGVVGISEEHRFDVGVVYTHMLHAVFLLVAACQLMLLDGSVEIVVDEGANHETILGLAIHGLGVDVILLLVVLYQPSLVLEHLEVFSSLLIHARVILAGTGLEVDFRFDDTIKTLLVVAGLLACLFRVEHVVRS